MSVMNRSSAEPRVEPPPEIAPVPSRDLAMAWTIAGCLIVALVGVPSVWRWETGASPAIEALAGQAILRGGAAADDHRHLPLSYDLAEHDHPGHGPYAIDGQPES